MGLLIEFDCKFRIKPQFKAYITEKIYKKNTADHYDFEIGNVPFQYRSLVRAMEEIPLKNKGDWKLDDTTNIVDISMRCSSRDFEYCAEDVLEEFVRKIIVPISTKIIKCDMFIPSNWGGPNKNISFEDYELRGCPKFNVPDYIHSIKHNMDDNGDIISTIITYKTPLNVDYTDDIEKHLTEYR